MIIRAPAKINLGLKVLYKRKDGYHELESLMQQIGLADFLSLKDSDNIEISCYGTDIPLKENLVYKTVLELQRIFKINRGASLVLYKNIPVGAGLAGGSTDAAATILALNKLWDLNLSMEKMSDIGEIIGADVPFCLLGGTALAGGKGEKLLSLPKIPFYALIMAKPFGLSVSTAAVFSSFKNDERRKVFSYDDLVFLLKKGERMPIIEWFKEQKDLNMLEKTVLENNPEAVKLKACFQEAGLHPMMSGSGPTFFALTTSIKKAYEYSCWIRQKGYQSWISWTM